MTDGALPELSATRQEVAVTHGSACGVRHLTEAEISAGLEWIRESPANGGHLEMIVCRPAEGQRQLLDSARLSTTEGLVGDSWRSRPSSSTPDHSPHPDKQLTLMNVRFASLIAGDPSRRALAGDQLYVDLDLSVDNAPPGTRLLIGTAVIELTEPPHTGCAKFLRRFGKDALAAVRSPLGLRLRLRGANAKVVTGGTIRTGDTITKQPEATGRKCDVIET